MTENITEQLLHQFRHCQNLIERRWHHRRPSNDALRLRDGQGKLLHLLSQHNEISQKQLAEMMDIRPASLSELVQKLAAKGLIERSIDETDKRVSNLKLTDSAKDIAQRMQQERTNMADTIFDALSQDEQQQLFSLLSKLSLSLAESESDDDLRHGERCRAMRGHRGGHHHGHGHRGHFHERFAEEGEEHHSESSGERDRRRLFGGRRGHGRDKSED
jgi:DNA-binding MarR family transcriptional regulator